MSPAQIMMKGDPYIDNAFATAQKIQAGLHIK